MSDSSIKSLDFLALSPTRSSMSRTSTPYSSPTSLTVSESSVELTCTARPFMNSFFTISTAGTASISARSGTDMPSGPTSKISSRTGAEAKASCFRSSFLD